ncbi:cytochrome P450 [Xylaria castorea]|nr:cytochrome P450 [Xylaria castorea]
MDLGPSEQQLNGPALAPPDGVVPNFTNPPNEDALGIAVISICLVLATTAGLLRAYSRIIVTAKLRIEDCKFLGLVAFAFYAALAWSIFVYIHYVGILVHQWNVQLKNLVEGAHSAFFTTFLYTFSMLFGKTAILVEWARIFVIPGSKRNFFYVATRAMIILNVAIYTAFSLLFIFFCNPIEKSWMSWVHGHCLDHRPHDIAIVSVNIALDLFILALPQKMIWSLNMSMHRRIGFSIVFSVGLLACGTAIGRAYLVTILDYQGDILYELSKTNLLAFVEVTCVLLVFCVPAIPRAFSEKTVLFRVVSTLRSWTQHLTSLSTERLRQSDHSASRFPPTIGSEPNKHIQRGSDEEGQALSLADLRLIEGQRGEEYYSIESTGQDSIQRDQHLGKGIVITTQVDQQAETGSRSSVERSIELRQHGWAAFLSFFRRLAFHPLSNYPGPFLAKVTYGYGGFYAFKGRHHVNTYKNFQKYGRVYRDAPNRLMFNSLKAAQGILFTVRDNAEHRRKRRVIGQVVSDRSLRSFNPMMSDQIDIFLKQLLRSSRQGEMVNMTVACNRLGIDVVGHLAFGCALKTQTEATNRFIPETMFSSIYVNNLYYTWPKFANLAPVLRWIASKKIDLFRQAVERMIAERTSKPANSIPDFYAVVTGEGGLHRSELWGEALFFVLAGGSTVATAMCGALFHLSWHPDAYARLAAEIRGKFSSGRDIQPGSVLASCTYLRAVIDESIRMTPPSPSPLWREHEVLLPSKSQPFIVDGHVIPPGTEVSIHLWAMMHDPEYFKDPFSFIPDRWLLPADEDASGNSKEQESRATMRRAHVAFGLGDRSCAGKSMAYMETSVTIARILWYFDFERAAGEAGNLGCGRKGSKEQWDEPNQFQIYDILGADHDGPNLMFRPRGKYWQELASGDDST